MPNPTGINQYSRAGDAHPDKAEHHRKMADAHRGKKGQAHADAANLHDNAAHAQHGGSDNRAALSAKANAASAKAGVSVTKSLFGDLLDVPDHSAGDIMVALEKSNPQGYNQYSGPKGESLRSIHDKLNQAHNAMAAGFPAKAKQLRGQAQALSAAHGLRGEYETHAGKIGLPAYGGV